MFAKIDARRPKYPDPDGLRAKAEAERRNERLATMYVEGLEAIDQREWKKAIQNFEALEREQRDYRQTRFYLTKAREQLAASIPPPPVKAQWRPEQLAPSMPPPRRPSSAEQSTIQPTIQSQTTELSHHLAEWSTLASILQRPIVRTIATLAVAAIACWLVAASSNEVENLKLKIIYGEIDRDLPHRTVAIWGLLVSIPGLAATIFKQPTHRSIVAMLLSGLSFIIGIYVFAFGFASGFAVADKFESAAIVEQARILFLGGWLGSVWGLALALTLFASTRRRSLLLLPFGIVGITATAYLSFSPYVDPEIPSLGAEGAVMGWTVWGVVAAGMLLWVNPQRSSPAELLTIWSIIQRQATNLNNFLTKQPVLQSILRRPGVGTITPFVTSAIGCWLIATSLSSHEIRGLRLDLIYGGSTTLDLSHWAIVKWGLLVAIPGLVMTIFRKRTRHLAPALLFNGLVFVAGVYVFYSFALGFAHAAKFENNAIVEQARILFLGSWLGLIWGLGLALTLYTTTRRRSLLLLPFGIISITAITFLWISPYIQPKIPNLGAEGAIVSWAVWGAATAGMLLWVNSQKVHQ